MSLRVFSFGGGVQSTAALVLAAQGRIDYKVFLFANVGEDSENPDTLEYIAQHSRPFAERHGLSLIELRRETRDGETLYQRTLRDERTIGIPTRDASGRPGRRSCTQGFKREVLQRWMKRNGATAESPATVGIGISVDEFQRVHPQSDCAWERIEYPLIRLRLDRIACRQIIDAVGLPQPPKSSCWFCPFKRVREWQNLRTRHPDLFAKAADLEQTLHDRSVAIGRMPVYLTRFGTPLAQAVDDGGQLPLFDEDAACDSGYCWR
jgi:hypothetical protein